MILDTQTYTAVDLTPDAGGLVADYTLAAAASRDLVAKVELGYDGGPIVGGGTYTLLVTLNGVPLSPNSEVPVPIGRDHTILVSRIIPVAPAGRIVIRVRGLAGDVAVNAVTTLDDVTPLRREEVTGPGPVPVDHDYGGTDALAVRLRNGPPVAGAVIRAYRKADYDAGDRGTDFAVAEVVTDANGRWRQPMTLHPGVYTLLTFKDGVTRPATLTLTVG